MRRILTRLRLAWSYQVTRFRGLRLARKLGKSDGTKGDPTPFRTACTEQAYRQIALLLQRYIHRYHRTYIRQIYRPTHHQVMWRRLVGFAARHWQMLQQILRTDVQQEKARITQQKAILERDRAMAETDLSQTERLKTKLLQAHGNAIETPKIRTLVGFPIKIVLALAEAFLISTNLAMILELRFTESMPLLLGFFVVFLILPLLTAHLLQGRIPWTFPVRIAVALTINGLLAFTFFGIGSIRNAQLMAVLAESGITLAAFNLFFWLSLLFYCICVVIAFLMTPSREAYTLQTFEKLGKHCRKIIARTTKRLDALQVRYDKLTTREAKLIRKKWKWFLIIERLIARCLRAIRKTMYGRVTIDALESRMEGLLVRCVDTYWRANEKHRTGLVPLPERLGIPIPILVYPNGFPARMPSMEPHLIHFSYLKTEQS